MKKKYYISLSLFILGINLYSQNVKITPELKIDSTKMKITKSDFSYYLYCSVDTKKPDSLIVLITSIGGSIALNIDLTNEPIAYGTLLSDYNEFDGNHTKRVEFENYELELNSTEFKKNNRIFGRFTGVTKPIENSLGTYQVKFSGEFSHIIGMLMIKHKPEDQYIIIDDF